MQDFIASHWGVVVGGVSKLLGVTTLVFVLGATCSYAWQLWKLKPKNLSLRSYVLYLFPPEIWKSKSTAMDIMIFIVSKLLGKLSFLTFTPLSVIVGLGISDFLGGAFPGFQAFGQNLFAIVVSTLLLLTVADFMAFFTHWLDHKAPILWELHKVHHSARVLTPLTTYRFHPLGDSLDRILTALVVGLPLGAAHFLYGFSIAELLLLSANAGIAGQIVALNALKHSHIAVSYGPLDHFLMSPHMHHLHHSEKYEDWDKNMGNIFSFWDALFGTLKIPAKGEKMKYGLGRGEEADVSFENPYGIYVRPLIEMTKLTTGKKVPDPAPNVV